jgi:hypothetical protein
LGENSQRQKFFHNLAKGFGRTAEKIIDSSKKAAVYFNRQLTERGNTMSIILHCGSKTVERNQLASPVLPPATNTYQPIGHDYFVDLVEDTLTRRGFEIMDQVHGLNNGGSDYFGAFKVKSFLTTDDYALMVGMRNSHSKRFGAGIVTGANVFVCDNMSFSGEVKAVRKHTAGESGNILVDLPQIVAGAVSKMVGQAEFQNARFEAYKERQLRTFEAEHIMVEMLRQGIMNAHRFPKMVQQWDAPDHDEFTRTGKSAWRLFNAATEAMKGSNVVELARKTEKLHILTDEVVELAA